MWVTNQIFHVWFFVIDPLITSLCEVVDQHLGHFFSSMKIQFQSRKLLWGGGGGGVNREEVGSGEVFRLRWGSRVYRSAWGRQDCLNYLELKCIAAITQPWMLVIKKPTLTATCKKWEVSTVFCIFFHFSVSNGGSLLKQCALLIKQNMSLILFSGWRSSHRHCLLHFSLTPSPKPSTLCWVSLATPQHRWGNLWIKPSHNAKHSYKKCLIIDWYSYLCAVPSHLIKCRSGAFLIVGSVPACLQLKNSTHIML